MTTLLQDLRYSGRVLVKSPAFTTVAVLTLALGIGANTAIFTLINAVLIKSLPLKDPQQLVLLTWDDDKWPPHFGQTGWDSKYSFSYPAFAQFRARKDALSSVLAWVPLGFNRQNTTVAINGEPTLADGHMVSGEFFTGLGVEPLAGRLLTEADESPAAPRAAVISYTYWTRQFARDPTTIGRSITLNGIPFTIVGVTPASFYGVQAGSEPDLWIPFDDKPNLRPWSTTPGGPNATNSVFTARNWLCLNVMARLNEGVSKAQAQAALDGLFHQLITADWHPPKADDVPHLMLLAGNQGLPALQENFQQPLFVLMIAVGLVLLIACANLATLLLARGTMRQKEISVRLAMGASRWRVIRQLLTESVLLSLVGGLLGLVLAKWSTDMLIALMSSSDTRLILDAGMDSKVLLFMFSASLLTGILFGLAPAIRASKFDLATAMKDAGNQSAARDKHRLSRSLIVAQVAASLVLMIGAGLFVRTLVNFEHHSFGFDQRNLLTFGLDPTRAGYHNEGLINLYSQLLERIQALPGVKSATLISNAPMSGWSGNTTVAVEGSEKPPASVRWQKVGSDFFQTMGMRIIAGRDIQRTDTRASLHVAVVDETFANKFLPGQNPIGRRLSLSPKYDPADSFEIVGLVNPAELTDPESDLRPKAYLPFAQFPKDPRAMFFEVRSQGAPAAIIAELRDTVHQTDPALPLIGLKTQVQETSDALLFERLFARLTTVFGLLALLLAVIGLYGTMAYSVTRKTREIGIRIALGASATDVLGMIIGQGVTLTLLGVAIGIAVAPAITRLISSMIFGVTPYDPLTFVLVAAILVMVALAACYMPARRAMRVDPLVALRYE
jgi:predicted permease